MISNWRVAVQVYIRNFQQGHWFWMESSWPHGWKSRVSLLVCMYIFIVLDPTLATLRVTGPFEKSYSAGVIKISRGCLLSRQVW